MLLKKEKTAIAHVQEKRNERNGMLLESKPFERCSVKQLEQIAEKMHE